MTPQQVNRLQAELAKTDQKFRDIHGDDDTEWSPLEAAKYERIMARVFAEFATVSLVKVGDLDVAA